MTGVSVNRKRTVREREDISNIHHVYHIFLIRLSREIKALREREEEEKVSSLPLSTLRFEVNVLSAARSFQDHWHCVSVLDQARACVRNSEREKEKSCTAYFAPRLISTLRSFRVHEHRTWCTCVQYVSLHLESLSYSRFPSTDSMYVTVRYWFACLSIFPCTFLCGRARQRKQEKNKKRERERAKGKWTNYSPMNALSEVTQLHCLTLWVQ